MRKKKLQASMTVEMSLLIPLVIFIFMELMLSVFFYHDKNILHAAAYETAIVGSGKIRTQEGITEEELEEFCRERLKGKCFYLVYQDIEIDITEENVKVKVDAAKRRKTISVTKIAAITEPEEKIRDRRRISNIHGT